MQVLKELLYLYFLENVTTKWEFRIFLYSHIYHANLKNKRLFFLSKYEHKNLNGLKEDACEKQSLIINHGFKVRKKNFDNPIPLKGFYSQSLTLNII